MNQLLDIVPESGDGTIEPPAEPLASQLAAWEQPQDPGIDPGHCLAGGPHLESSVRHREPGNRRELRIHGHPPASFSRPS
jgi:hypothetical protein